MSVKSLRSEAPITQIVEAFTTVDSSHIFCEGLSDPRGGGNVDNDLIAGGGGGGEIYVRIAGVVGFSCVGDLLLPCQRWVNYLPNQTNTHKRQGLCTYYTSVVKLAITA